MYFSFSILRHSDRKSYPVFSIQTLIKLLWILKSTLNLKVKLEPLRSDPEPEVLILKWEALIEIMIHLVGRNVLSGWVRKHSKLLVGLHVNCEGKLKLTITTLLLLSNRGTPLSIITKYTIQYNIVNLYKKCNSKPIHSYNINHLISLPACWSQTVRFTQIWPLFVVRCSYISLE